MSIFEDGVTTVKQLIDALKKYPDDMKVVLCHDAALCDGDLDSTEVCFDEDQQLIIWDEESDDYETALTISTYDF